MLLNYTTANISLIAIPLAFLPSPDLSPFCIRCNALRCPSDGEQKNGVILRVEPGGVLVKYCNSYSMTQSWVPIARIWHGKVVCTKVVVKAVH